MISSYLSHKQEKPKEFGEFIVQEGRKGDIQGLLQDLKGLREEQERLRNLLNRTPTPTKSDYKQYLWKDIPIMAKIIEQGEGFVILQSDQTDNGNFYISVNGVLYKMPHRLYMQRIVRTPKYLLALDDLGVTYHLDDKEFIVKYLDTYADRESTYSLKDKELVTIPLKQLVTNEGTVYKQLADGVLITYPDGRTEFLKGARLVKTKDGYKVLDKDGNELKDIDDVISSQYLGEGIGVEKTPIGELLIDGKLRPIYKDANGFYYVDDQGNKHYLTSDQLLQLAKEILQAELIGFITDEYGNKVGIYKDAKGYFYVDEKGERHYIEMTPELLNKLIDENGFVMANIDGKIRQIFRDENGYYYIDEEGNKHYVTFEQLKDNLVGRSVYMADNEKLIMSQLTDAQKKALASLGAYEKMFLGVDGNLYVQDKDGNIYRIRPDGTIEKLGKGELFVENGMIKMKTAAGTILDLEKYKIDMTDAQKKALDKIGDYTAMYMGADGNLYVQGKDGNVYKISPDGTITNLGKGELFVENGMIKFRDANGNVKTLEALKISMTSAQQQALAKIGDYTAMYMGADGNLYVQDKNGNVYRIRPDGTIENLGKGTLFVEDGMIKMKTAEGTVINLEGEYKFRMTDAQKDSLKKIGAYDAMYMDADGNLFVQGKDGNVYKISPDGTITNLGKGTLFTENGIIKMRNLDGTVTELGKLSGNPVAFVERDGKWYAIDAYGNMYEVDKDKVAKYFDQYGSIEAMVDGQMRKLYKDKDGFFYIDENGNKVYVDADKLKQALEAQGVSTGEAKYLGPGMEFTDTQGNRYFMNENGEIIKISPDGTVTNLGKGRLFVDSNGNIIFEDTNGNRQILGYLDDIKLKADSVFDINGKRYGITSDNRLVEFNPTNKSIIDLGKIKGLYYDKEGNLILETQTGKKYNLGAVGDLFRKDDLLANLKPEDLIGKALPTAEIKPPELPKKEEAPTDLLAEMQRRMEEERRARERGRGAQPQMMYDQRTGRQRPSQAQIEQYPMQGIVETKPTAYMDFVKINDESTFKKSKIVLGNVKQINLPTGTELEGHVMFGVLAPSYDRRGYTAYSFIKLDKNVLLKNNIDVGTYDGILVAQVKGDPVTERVLFSPFRVSFYDNGKKRENYYDGEFDFADATSGSTGGSASGGYDFIRGAVISTWDGLEGLPGIMISRQDELVKWTLSSGMLSTIGDFLRTYASPYGAIMGDTEDEQRFRDLSMGQAMQQGAVAGMGDAFQQLTQYQLDMARMQIPVIASRGGNDPKYRVKIITPTPIHIKKFDILEYEQKTETEEIPATKINKMQNIPTNVMK
jgi:hypothetical protein